VLEIVVVFLLARHNGRMVEGKGLRGTMYRWGTVGFWFGGEILGSIIGLAASGRHSTALGIYLFALLGAALGAVLAYLWAKQASPAPAVWAMTPPTGVPAWASPTPGLPPVTTIPAGVQLRVEQRVGDWAMVRASNGWTGWVDARQLG
jgi:hypothetical protein